MLTIDKGVFMYTNKVILSDYQLPFPLDIYAPLEQILFIDIETTGLSPSNSNLYMLGLVYYKNNSWCIEQWMAERLTEERELLRKLADFLPNFTHLIHFNGNRFDIPYLTEKGKELFVELSLDKYAGIDIYKRIMPLKNALVLPDCRLKTIEQFLGINRIDKYTGGELIQVYKAYTAAPSTNMLDLLIQHNLDDLKGMLDITAMLAYSEICDTPSTVTRVEMQKTTSINGSECYELVLTLKLPFTLPRKFFAHFDNNLVTADGSKATIKVPVFEKELKFFYSNYKDYYYIPSMDAAYHKSVAGHVDASLRTQATASTCYTRKESIFLKQYDVLVEPFFKQNYKDKESYFEITDETKTNRTLFSLYSNHILRTIIQGQKSL